MSLETAVEMLLQCVQPVGTEKISIKSALGRVLSEDLFAPINLPPFNRSPLDGYAVRSEDIATAAPDRPVLLEIRQEIPVGSYSTIELGRNQAAKVMTGSPLPSGADVVIKFEDVKIINNKVEVAFSLPSYANYCFAGEDIQQGERVLCKGNVIDPASIGILAALGISVVPVYCLPKVAIIVTGEELVEITEQLKPGKIFNSNSYVLAAYIRQAGVETVRTEIVNDNKEKIARKISENLESVDMVITTGGVSVGDYDFVREALISIGAELLFHKIAMRPGSPALSAVKDGKLIICLSGNQAAAFTTFHLLAVPVLAGLMGMAKRQLSSTTAVLVDDYPKNITQRNFLRGQAFFDDGHVKVRLTGKQNPGIIKSTFASNALIDVPADTRNLKAGTRVKIFFLHSLFQNSQNELF